MAKFRLSGLPEFEKNMRKQKEKLAKRAIFALNEWAEDTITVVGQQIQKAGAVDQGQLLGATTHLGAYLTGDIVKNKVFNPTEHALVIEFGRRPGQGKPPPILPIAAWASRKGIVSTPRNLSFDGQYEKQWKAAFGIRNRKDNKEGSGEYDPTQQKQQIDPIIKDLLIIISIRDSIFENGFEGRYPFTKAFEIQRPRFAKYIAKKVR